MYVDGGVGVIHFIDIHVPYTFSDETCIHVLVLTHFSAVTKQRQKAPIYY